MKILLRLYKVARSVLFSVIIAVAALYLLIYILLSAPVVQNEIREVAQKELSKFLGGRVEINSLGIRPFNEVSVSGLRLFSPQGEKCLEVETVGAGINLWRLLRDRRIEFSYGEIIGLRGWVRQQTQDSPLNIQFVIDAFKPKDKNKPPARFDINLRNVVLRRCALSYDRMWMPADSNLNKTDFNHTHISDLRADVTFPQLKNDDFIIDLRRLSFEMSGGLEVEKIAFKTHITPNSFSLKDFVVQLPSTEIRPSDISLQFDSFNEIKKSLTKDYFEFVLADNKLCPADFGWLVPGLRHYPEVFTLNLKAEGNLENLSLGMFSLTDRNNIRMMMSGSAHNPASPSEMQATIDELTLSVSQYGISELCGWIPSLKPEARKILGNLGGVKVEASGDANLGANEFSIDSRIETGCGNLFLACSADAFTGGSGDVKGELTLENLELGNLLGKPDLGLVNADVNVTGTLKGRDFDGDGEVYISRFTFKGVDYEGIVAELSKKGKDYDANVNINNRFASLALDAYAHLDGAASCVNAACDIRHVVPSEFGVLPAYDGYTLAGNLAVALEGDNIDNALGEVRLTDFAFSSAGASGKSIKLDRLLLKSESEDDGGRHISLQSDWVDGDITGTFKARDLASEVQLLASSVMPAVVRMPGRSVTPGTNIDFSLLLHADNTLPEFFNLPVRMLVPIPVEGSIDGDEQKASLAIDIPYIQQGKNKLLRDNRITMTAEGENNMANIDISTTFPVKRGELATNISVMARDNRVFTDIDWINTENSNFKGLLSIGALVSKNELTARPEIDVEINPTTFGMGSAKWNIDKSRITYADNMVSVDDIKIWRDNQFVEINGNASAYAEDTVSVKLNDIDLDYVFETLNINYVTFGGTATGELTARGALSKNPVASTDGLHVKGLSYNGAVLGDALIKSRWNNEAKEVEINADIREDGRWTASIDGGIWIGRDSLSFGIDAKEVNIAFMAPFMSAFASDLSGRASGEAKLFGTFSDIDLTGRLHADTISMKLDFTNTYYHGSDSVYLNPGHIVIPAFTLHDKYGNSAVLNGELTHRYFHEPAFNFRISDAKEFLCYDTNSKINPDWYGTIYGNGSASVMGWPGTVAVSVDMAIAEKSAFTFVLNDTEAAADYHFLTFSDKRKEELQKNRGYSVPDVIAAFRKKVEKNADTPTRFLMDIRASVTPVALLTLVMDPVAGDKITARGSGAVQIDYESDSDEMQMFGKYILEEGNYNFSLQDLILRDFRIKSGSAISFNGDPFNANLDITASYRVNTNLSDLDKSFSTDRDLARTNVPVDALLMVKGEMQHPDITFDIELPTLTQDVSRKVKSIISTDDMMSRQIIYLLALNRFYTPEYMGSSGNGGELAAVASTTLSTQLQNMLGQLTDKFTLAPTFRSDKGDFSDLEVDVALSSRLLNNRLLVNGNFGYRDKSTSNTTFIGDFDIEYLLNRSGNLRLKAYNHFNDQNYYLREALTTQGLGIVYRRDFDNPFTWLHRRKKNNAKDDKNTAADSVSGAQKINNDNLLQFNKSDSVPKGDSLR